MRQSEAVGGRFVVGIEAERSGKPLAGGLVLAVGARVPAKLLGGRCVAGLDHLPDDTGQNVGCERNARLDGEKVGRCGEIDLPPVVVLVAIGKGDVLGFRERVAFDQREREPFGRIALGFGLEGHAEPSFRRFGVVAAKIVPAEQPRVARARSLPGQSLDAGDVFGAGGHGRVFAGGGQRVAREVVAHRRELAGPIVAETLQRQEFVAQIGRKKLRRILHRRQALLRVVAGGEDVAIGIARAGLALGHGEGFGNAPEHVDLRTGQQARILGPDAHDRLVLVEIGRVHQPFARLGNGEPVQKVGRRLPLRLGHLTLGDRLARFGEAPLRIEQPDGLETLVDAQWNGQRIGRRCPGRIKSAQARDLHLQPARVALAREIAKRRFVDGRHRLVGRRCRHRRLGDQRSFGQ